MRGRRLPDEQPKARLGDILAPYESPEENGGDALSSTAVIEAIKEAYRLGHTHGRHAIIRNDEQTFIERLREKQNG